MSKIVLLWLALLGLLLGLGAGAARADDPRSSPEYKELIRKALQEYELGNWGEAKVFFSDAHALFPNARTLRGLGLTAYAERNYVKAIDYFEQALANPVQPLTSELQSSVRELVGQAKRFVARVTLNVHPKSAQLRVDDMLVTPDADGVVQLNPGQHELIATAPGYEARSRQWKLDAGARSELSIELKSQAAAVPAMVAAPMAAPPSPSTPAARSGTPATPWIIAGVSGALAIGGGVLLALTASDISTVEDAKKYTSWSEVEPAYERTAAMSAAGFSMLGIGIVGVAVGLTWGLWPEESAEERLAFDLAPGRVGLHGQF